MAKRAWTVSGGGGWLILISALAGLAISLVNYFNPQSGIAGEPGTILVIASTAILAIFGWLLSAGGPRGTFFRGFILGSSLLNIAGTMFAGYLLHSESLVVLMLVSLLGWILCLFRRRRALA